MTAPGTATPAATAPGRAAYEAYVADLTAPVADIAGTLPFAPWDGLTPQVRHAMEAAAQAAIKAGVPELTGLMEAAWQQRDETMDELAGALAERDDYRNRLRAADEGQPRLAAERDGLREQLTGLRDHIDSLALGLEMSASTTAPSRKSEIESGCASALRGLLRTDGESDEDTRQRLGRERDSLAGRVDGLVSKAGELREERDRLADALAGNPDPLVSALQSQVEHFRELIAEILDALDHGGPYWAEEWRERAGLSGSPGGSGGRDGAA